MWHSRSRVLSFRAAAVLLGLLLATAGPRAAEKQQLPVPRFVSMKHGQANVRVGPGEQYPVAWVFTRLDMPVEIIQEFDIWRKIRDWEGTEGWVRQGQVQSKRFVIVKGEIRALRREPAADAAAVARLEPGVIARLDKCPAESLDWCRLEVGDLRGWIRRGEVWGVYPGEVYPPP